MSTGPESIEEQRDEPPADGSAQPRCPAPAENVPPPERCPICESPMYAVHCKLICPQCGYREDCSDIFRI